MGRILAIDFGIKRTGLAISDPLQMFGQPLETIPTEEILAYVEKLNQKDPISEIVIGLPLTLNNDMNDISPLVKACADTIKKKFPDILIHTIDERFTSSIASQTILLSGISKEKRKNKALVDKISAAILLNDYLELRKNQKK
ncbi:MAG: Holliday junction resolvase RuvX [Bacteroidia bacterium]|nr:Holliday junction resolvase RuvX [Bacteroidia bacterium]